MGHASNLIAAVAAAMLMMSTAMAKPASTFDSDAEGWGVTGPVDGGLSWSALAGNPGGAISVRTIGAGNVAFFAAPAEFLGDQSSLIGQKLVFDFRYDFPRGVHFYGAALELHGAGLKLVGAPSEEAVIGDYGPVYWARIGTFLHHIDHRTSWSVGSMAGRSATPEQFAAVMGDLTALHIRATAFIDVPGTATLDNVAVVGIPEPSVSALFGLGAVVLLCVSGGKRARRPSRAAT